MPGVDKKWAERIRAGDRRVLLNQFRDEAAELRRILMEQPASFHPPWRDFRNFLADVGPSPGPSYHIHPTRAGPGAYRPDNVSWIVRNGREASERGAPPPDSRETYSQWTMISGAPVQCADLASRYGLSFAALSAAAAAGIDLATVVEQAQAARAETADLSWFSPNEAHQQAFREAYRTWKLHVQPKYRSAATPKFLYLCTLIPSMARCKATLSDADLWRPLTKAAVDQRDGSAAWKRFNELLPKAAMIVAEFDIYRQYSLTEDIDELSQRLQAAEVRFRTGVAKPSARAA